MQSNQPSSHPAGHLSDQCWQDAGLPVLCDSPPATFCFLAIDSGIFVCYERKRDFLSAPRAFVVLEFDKSVIVTLNASDFTEAQWQALEALPFGVYRYVLEARTGYVFANEEQVIDIQTPSIARKDEYYHCESEVGAIARAITARTSRD